MERFLVHQADVSSGMHAIVIGVGEYPHLIGGAGSIPDFHEGMKQLSSPPVSARAIANWLCQEYHHPAKPLASLSLLLSEPGQSKFENPATGETIDVEKPTIANVTDAIREWTDRGDQSSENSLFFYYGGHGISKGTTTSLLTADFNKSKHSPLDGAVDFSLMHLGMKRCQARQQLYFIDVCRTISDTLLHAGGFHGVPVIVPSDDIKKVLAPVFYSTLKGAKAFGRQNQVSVFTEFLLKALRGGGADNVEDEDIWWVNTSRLKEAIDSYLFRAAEQEKIKDQVSSSDDVVSFNLHLMQTMPIADVEVVCDPEEANSLAILECNSEDPGNPSVPRRETPSSTPWRLELPFGRYSFSATFPANSFPAKKKSRTVRPFLCKVPIKVE